MKYEPLVRRLLDKEYLYVNSDHLQKDIRIIKEGRYSNIFILGAENYKLNNVNWLAEIGETIESIIITPLAGISFSYSGLAFCGNLLNIRINNEVDVPIDLSSNCKVKSLSLLKYRKVTGINHIQSLQSLVLTRHIPSYFLTYDWISNFPNLKNLSLLGINLSEGFGFLKGRNLKTLTIFNSRNISMEGILNTTIKELDVDRCKNVKYQENIFKLNSLISLKLIDSIFIDDARRFLDLTNLKVLVVMGTSNIEKGNLSCLKGKLRHFGFDNKRHYDTKYEEFKENYLAENGSQIAT